MLLCRMALQSKRFSRDEIRRLRHRPGRQMRSDVYLGVRRGAVSLCGLGLAQSKYRTGSGKIEKQHGD